MSALGSGVIDIDSNKFTEAGTRVSSFDSRLGFGASMKGHERGERPNVHEGSPEKLQYAPLSTLGR